MKKYLSMLAVMAVAASAFSQGTVNFQNSTATAVKAGADLASAVPVANNGGFVQLLWAPSGTAATEFNAATYPSLTAWLNANPGWQKLDASIKAVGPAPGIFLGGKQTVPTATPGAPIAAAVAAWTGNYATFDLAQAAGANIGISAPFAITTGNPTTTPEGLPASITAAGFAGVTALAVPEPSSLALAGLGAAALLIFRRRQ
jgi:hypothetical protein